MQTLLIILLFFGAIGYMALRIYQTMSRKDAGCGKGCGCATDTAALKKTAKQPVA